MSLVIWEGKFGSPRGGWIRELRKLSSDETGGGNSTGGEGPVKVESSDLGLIHRSEGGVGDGRGGGGPDREWWARWEYMEFSTVPAGGAVSPGQPALGRGQVGSWESRYLDLRFIPQDVHSGSGEMRLTHLGALARARGQVRTPDCSPSVLLFSVFLCSLARWW